MPSYQIVTLGCKLNQADSTSLEVGLLALGMTRAGDAAHGGSTRSGGADLVVLNSCTVTSGADREARQIARRLRRQHPKAVIVATGCYAERDAAGLRASTAIDHIVGMRDQAGRLQEYAASTFGLDIIPGERVLNRFGATAGCDSSIGPVERTRAYLKIQDGCDLRCSYCIIPSVRGASRSVSPAEVLRRIEELSGAGYREIVFTGVNTGDYGKDLDSPTSLHDLLELVLRSPELGRLRLNSLEPKTISSGIVSTLASSGGRLARHLQIPLQSGSDAILARMRRPYRAADYRRVLHRLRREVPEIGLGADVIVGFPGETAADFQATCDLVSEVQLNYLHVFPYSPRPGTGAANLPDQLDRRVIKERSACLRRLAREISLRFRRSFLGRTLPVLTLREIRRDGRLRALSDNFIDLGLDLDIRPTRPLMNQLLTARITHVTDTDTLATVA